MATRTRWLGLGLMGMVLGLSPALMGPAVTGCPDCLHFDALVEVPAGDDYFFSVEVPSGSRGDFIMRPSQGDPDLYCNVTPTVSPTQFVCGPQLGGLSEEVCAFEPTTTTKYHCVVHAAANVDAKFTLWVTEADAGCHMGAPGSTQHCSPGCTCGYQLGDCDSDSECAGGLTCTHDVGKDYGWSHYIDVCL